MQGGGSFVNRMEFVTIAVPSNATDFGDLTVARLFCSGTSSATWAGGGYASPTVVNVIDFTTIASAGDAQDFGDLLVKEISRSTFKSNQSSVWWWISSTKSISSD